MDQVNESFENQFILIYFALGSINKDSVEAETDVGFAVASDAYDRVEKMESRFPTLDDEFSTRICELCADDGETIELPDGRLAFAISFYSDRQNSVEEIAVLRDLVMEAADQAAAGRGLAAAFSHVECMNTFQIKRSHVVDFSSVPAPSAASPRP